MTPLRYPICILVLSGLVCCVPQQAARTDLKPPEAPPRQIAEAPAPPSGTLIIRPVPAQPSSPAVSTGGDLPTYVADLERCRSRVATRLGRDDGDNVAAVRRAIADRPLDGKLTVHFTPDDAAMVRDQAVRKCLRGRGYAVNG